MEKKPPEVSPKPPKVKPKLFRERSSSHSAGFKLPLLSKSVKTGGWRTSALEFHGQVSTEIERLIQKIDDPSKAKEACDMLEKAKLPLNKGKMTPELFTKKAELLVSLMQRIIAEKITLQAPPPKKPKEKGKEDLKVGRLSSKQLHQLNLESTIMMGQYRSYDVPTGRQAASQHGKGVAIPLCYPNDMQWDQKTNKCSRLRDVERNQLILNPQAIEILRAVQGPVCVIAIVGPCRSGKSYILSRLISSAGETCHFHLGHEMDPKTMGIWMWDQPFKMKLKNYQEEVTIILLDTEGIDAANATAQGDSQIFTLSVLLSSLMIYNSMSVPKREDLNQLHFVANLSKSIQVQAGQSAVGAEGVKLADSNPKFMWLLRDVILTPTDAKGKDCHIKDYLLQKVLVDDASSDDTDNNIRQCILSFFSGFDAETLPPPSTEPHVMQNIENPLYQKDISPIFLQKVEYARKRIFNNSFPKKGFSEGSIISGFQLAHMVELYVEALNSPGGIPVIGSTWQRVLEATYTDGIEKALQTYCEIMTTVIQYLPMESGQLLKSHRDAVEKSMEIFNKAVSLDSESELYQTYLDKLMAKIVVYDDEGECRGGELALYLEKNYSQSKLACQSLLRSLREKYLDPVITQLTPDTDFKTIEDAFLKVVSGYNGDGQNKESVGPASDEVLESFIEEQEKQRDQLDSQLSTIKNYNTEAKLRMKEMKEQQCFFEQKEVELKQRMEQSKRDQETKLKAMQDKFKKDADNLRKESDKKMEEQQKRLQNMADANLQKVKQENTQQLNQLRAALAQRENELRQRDNQIQAEIRRKQAEADWLRRQQEEASRRRKKKGGCFIAGTTVMLSDGTSLNLEKQTGGLKILALGGETATITDEFVDHTLSAGYKIFGFNDDVPFAALHHPFWTTEGWKCLDPETAKEENPDVDFKLLQVGDIIFQIARAKPFLYEPVKIRQFTYRILQAPTKIYGLHLIGRLSYHANGYAVMANYPVLTKKRICKGMDKLAVEEKERLRSAISSVEGELTKVLGSWAKEAFNDMGLTKKAQEL